MKVLAIIPARGGSKGIPGKNIRLLGGKPLIVWTIKAARKSRYINRIIVSSDSEEILSISEKFGAETMKRPANISGDNSPYQLLIRHLLKKLRAFENYVPDILVYLQPTSPLRNNKDIDSAIEYLNSKKADAVISVYELDKKYLKSFVTGPGGYLKGPFNDQYPFKNRQDLPQPLMPNGAIYVAKTASFLKNNQLFSDKTVPYVMDSARSIDIDTLDDFKAVEKVLLKSKFHA